MLSFQEGMGEMSHKQQNLILTGLQFRKNYQCPLRRLQLDLATLYSRNFFLSCSENYRPAGQFALLVSEK